MNIRLFKHARLLHKWIGFVCALFVLILSASGVLLMHHENLGLEKIMVSGEYLSKKYFQVEGANQVVQSIAVGGDGKTIYAGTNRGLFRSRDAGSQWVELRDGLFNQNIRALATRPGAPNVVYAGTAKGIFKSEDGGDRWTDWFEESSGLTNSTINDLLIPPGQPDTLFAATQGGLFLSRDGGETWETSFKGDLYEESKDVRVARVSSADPEAIYIGTGKGVYRSGDTGKTWEKRWGDINPDIFQIVSLNTEPEFFYVGTREGLYKSFNQGITWTQDGQLNRKAVQSIFIDPHNSSQIYAAAGDRLLFSKDGGDRWDEILATPGKNVSSVADLPASLTFTQIIKLAAPSPLLLAGTQAGLIVSNDDGRHWTHQNLGGLAQNAAKEPRQMNLLKLVTEIHTGRLFGSYFYLLVDIASLGLILLIFSGIAIAIYRAQLARRKKAHLETALEKELETDIIIDIRETADDLSHESLQIHGMVEHINQHLEKCKSIYMSKEKKEIEKIGKHIHTLDKKMHHLMNRIGEFEKISQN